MKSDALRMQITIKETMKLQWILLHSVVVLNTHINEAIKTERKQCIVVFSASLYLQRGECRPLGGRGWKVTLSCEGGFRR